MCSRYFSCFQINRSNPLSDTSSENNSEETNSSSDLNDTWLPCIKLPSIKNPLTHDGLARSHAQFQATFHHPIPPIPIQQVFVRLVDAEIDSESMQLFVLISGTIDGEVESVVFALFTFAIQLE